MRDLMVRFCEFDQLFRLRFSVPFFFGSGCGPK